MLINARELTDFTVKAADGGAVGRVQDLLFDDRTWAVRYLRAVSGTARDRKHVLIPVHAFKEPHLDRKEFNLNIARGKIDESPDLDIDRPITFDYEVRLADYYEWPVYPSAAHEIMHRPDIAAKGMQTAVIEDELEERQLLGVNEVAGYRVRASSGDEIGELAGITVDDILWTVRYLPVALSGGQGTTVLMAPGVIGDILTEKREVTVNVLKQNVVPNASYDELDFQEATQGEKPPLIRRGAKLRGRKSWNHPH